MSVDNVGVVVKSLTSPVTTIIMVSMYKCVELFLQMAVFLLFWYTEFYFAIDSPSLWQKFLLACVVIISYNIR